MPHMIENQSNSCRTHWAAISDVIIAADRLQLLTFYLPTS